MLKYSVILSFCVGLISLTVLILRTSSFGKRAFYAEPAAKGKRGVRYALTRGLMPWEKESARKHLWTYGAGVLYHAGIFAGLFYLSTLVFSLHLHPLLLRILQILMVMAVVCGAGLLARRFLLPSMRRISCVDDYVSNVLVDLLLIFAFAEGFIPDIQPVLFVTASVLFLYIPLGKIRHCFFFFYSRGLYGFFFGRRGVLPPRRQV